MPAERAGYTVTMFLVDTSPTMGNMRTVDLPPGPNGEERTTEITNLEWALLYVKTKVQEMIFNGRKTDQCGVIVFGSETTDNMVNAKSGGYENVEDYISIGTPNVQTLAKLDALQPTEETGDPIDALIVAMETQNDYLAKKKTWTRKIVMVTDGQSQIETEDWEATIDRLNDLGVHLTIVGVDFDSPEWGYEEENKSTAKRNNEAFFHKMVERVKDGKGVIGTCAEALEEVGKPDQKIVRSALMATVLRMGDADRDPDVAIELSVRASKTTALQRPATMKKYVLRPDADEDDDEMEVDDEEDKKAVFAQLKMRTEYYVDRNAPAGDQDEDVKMEPEDDAPLDEQKKDLEKVDKEELIRGFKYGTTHVPCPDGQYPKLETHKGITICGFFPAKNFRREWAMGEVQYIWADPNSAHQQVALSSLVQALENKGRVAIARWVSRDGMDPKMGVLKPCLFDQVHCLLWVQMPFADDVRRYTFASLDHLVSKKGEVLTEHPYLPTKEQLDAMDEFVDAMDLGDAGEKDENGVRQPWFSPSEAYNPAIHRIKQAIFHSAVVPDITTHPIPPPHPDLTMFFEPPKRAVKRAKAPLDECKKAFNVKKVPKRVGKAKKDEHSHAKDEGDDEELLLDKKGKAPLKKQATVASTQVPRGTTASPTKLKITGNDSGSETEDEEDEDEDLLLNAKGPAPSKGNAPPTPARPASPDRAPGRIIGSTHPLEDFKKNIAQGDVVSKAVEDLGAVLTEIVLKPFGGKRKGEVVECMKVMRGVCLEEDEVEGWNAFLVDLKKKALAPKPAGNAAFWEEVKKVGRGLSLISDKEAKKFLGRSQYSEKQAEEFVSS